MSDRPTGQRRGRRSLASLAFDASGTTLAMMAMAMIPMSAMAGSAVDMTRLYVVKVRLQQACDAGALAARKFMTGTTLASDAEQQAQQFFASNFPEGWFSTTDVLFTPTATADNQVTATATATVPMAVMQMVGVDPIELEVSCDAKLEISNADIMFVLDVTGSMNCAVGVAGNCGGTEASNAKIRALRTAVVDFYDTIDTAVDNDARLRFGFVPYSSGVNVGALLPSGYLVDSWTYQSREANMYTPTVSAPVQISTEVSNDSERSTWCTNWGNANPTTSGSPPNTVTTTYYAYGDWGATGDTSGDHRTCRRKRTQTTTTYVQDNVNGTWFRNWTYRPVVYDVSQYKLGTPITTRTGNGGTNVESTWDGCIEERDTDDVSTPPSSLASMPDLDIDLIPSTDGTRWRPTLPKVIYHRSGTSSETHDNNNWQPTAGNDYYACPKAARQLDEMTRVEVAGYVSASNGFRPVGGTYHDFGMIWGARMLSPTGIFAADNAEAPNGKPISRHLIFMTDGDMSPNRLIYGLYGMEFLDRRVSNSPTDSDLKIRHNARFARLCTEARNKNITIWVVAYAQSMTTELRECATPGKAYFAANDDQLKEAFKNIAQQIADLRLSR